MGNDPDDLVMLQTLIVVGLILVALGLYQLAEILTFVWGNIG